MRILLVVAATVLSALALSACEKQPAATPAPPVVINVPGPAGPPGPAGAPAQQGATGMTGAQGEKGAQGEGTILVVPAPDPQR
jgi:hypothetical protein